MNETRSNATTNHVQSPTDQIHGFLPIAKYAMEIIVQYDIMTIRWAFRRFVLE